MPHTPLPYGRQSIDELDIQAVVDVLRSDRLTTGPKVAEFENAFADVVGADAAVAVCNGTAGLQAAYAAAGIGAGDEVIVPTLTFAATANAVLYQHARPVFADVDPRTLLIDPADVAQKITSRTRAVVAVDYAGQPAAYDELHHICRQHGLVLIADACHALGASYRGQPVGTLADLSVFSLHPVKPITAGEGGVVTTNRQEFAGFLRRFRHHGIDLDVNERERRDAWYYEVVDLGYNFRLSDLQCALALSQLRHLRAWTERRNTLAARYQEQLKAFPEIQPLAVEPHVRHAYHLFVVRVTSHERLDRQALFQYLRSVDIGAHVHYIPVHLHPYYRRRLGTCAGQCPHAEQAYDEILTLPLFPGMAVADVDRVVDAIASFRQASGQRAA